MELLNQAVPGFKMSCAIPKLAEAAGFVTIQRLTVSVKVGERTVTLLRNKGLIERKIIHQKLNKAYVLYPMDVASEIIEVVKSRTSISRAAHSIGISRAGVENLAAVDFLIQDRSPVLKKIYSDLHITESSLEALRCRLEAQLPIKGNSGTILLRQALRALPAGRKPWAVFIRHVLQGALPLQRSTTELNLREAAICLNDVPLLVSLADGVGEVGSTLNFLDELDAIEFLSCTSQQLRALMAGGLLRSTGKYSGKTFSVTKLEQIASSMISASEARERGRLAGPAVYRAIFHKGGPIKKGQDWADRAAVERLIPRSRLAQK